MYKHTAQLVPREGMIRGEFVDYWQTNRIPIGRERFVTDEV